MTRVPNKAKNWLKTRDLLIPFSSDEAMLWGPFLQTDHNDFVETVRYFLLAKCRFVACGVTVRRYRAIGITVKVGHDHFLQDLYFTFPPMRAVEVVSRIWSAITTATKTPNLDPVAYARESLLRDYSRQEGK